MPTKKQTTKKVNMNKGVVLSDREAPLARKMTDSQIVASVMNKAQMTVLLARTPEHAIKTRVGPGGKPLRYVSHGWVTDQLNAAFGFDWDFKLLPYFAGSVYHLETIQLGINNKTKEPIIARYVAVYGELTVKIHHPHKPEIVVATIVKPGPGSSVWYKENELGDAIKAAKSDGLKVAAHELGIALDLYWDDMAEQSKMEELKQQAERKRQQQETDEIIDATSESMPIPENGIQMIGMASAQFGYALALLEQITGRKGPELISGYSADDWEKVIKHYEENGNAKKEGKGR
jgi:hypothetical protein